MRDDSVRRRISIVTGSRADFGHLTDLAKAVAADPDLELQLVVTGSHLSARHGMTVWEIEDEGLPIAERVDIGISADTNATTAQSTGTAVSALSAAFERQKPDLVVLLGDRFEILGAAVAALVMRIPIVHLHGGEVTTGAFDDSMRHAISKMASIHFVAAEPYRERLIRMGEDPRRVFNFGAPVLESVRKIPLFSRADLERDLGMTLGRPLVLMTFHPVTRSVAGSLAELDALLAALDRFPEITLVVTGANSDPDNIAVQERMTSWATGRKTPVKIVESLGRRRYVSLLAIADAMAGNSSSGYIEAPAFGLPVIDIGDRQTGRLAASCVERVAAEPAAIAAALRRSLATGRGNGADIRHPYDSGPFVSRAIEILKTAPLGIDLLRKPFHDAGLPHVDRRVARRSRVSKRIR